MTMKLIEHAREHQIICTSASILGWDQETYMPNKASEFRAEQLSWLSARAHELSTSQAWREAIEAAEKLELHDDPRMRANVNEMRRRFDQAAKLPVALVSEITKTSSLAKRAWIEARQANDFAAFAPHLQKLIDLSKQKAEYWGYESELYDSLLDCHERGASTAQVSLLFDQLRQPLSALAKEAAEKSALSGLQLPAGPYPIDKQQQLNEAVARDIGYDFGAGRIDTTAHPFCTTLGPHDIRMTTRYDQDDFTSSLFGVLHEAGHGMYEQGLPDANPGMADADAVSLGIHESQSRLWENHVGRSRGFWEKWYPLASSLFPQLKQLSLDEFLVALNQAKFSFIRVGADEATYDLHILLRFDLERRIFRNQLIVADLPQAWNELFHELFGITPPDYQNGCLQDIHWSMGAFGYFPTYTLGNLNAAQLFHAAKKDATIASGIASANYGALLTWLRQNIHQHGALYDPAELMKKATGEVQDPKYHLAHLKARYVD